MVDDGVVTPHQRPELTGVRQVGADNSRARKPITGLRTGMGSDGVAGGKQAGQRGAPGRTGASEQQDSHRGSLHLASLRT